VEQQKKDLSEEYHQLGQTFYLGGWVQSELKDIRQEIRDLRLEMKSVESSLRQKLEAVETGLRQDMAGLEQKFDQRLGSLEQKMNALQSWIIATLLTVAMTTVGLAMAIFLQ
jgi:flagellar motility protein MotE (MotC chaperone)